MHKFIRKMAICFIKLENSFTHYTVFGKKQHIFTSILSTITYKSTIIFEVNFNFELIFSNNIKVIPTGTRLQGVKRFITNIGVTR